MKTALITGCPSGDGLETARHFLAQGWRAVATMRTPRWGLLPASERLAILPLDVTTPAAYTASMTAIEGFTASLAHELHPRGIRTLCARHFRHPGRHARFRAGVGRGRGRVAGAELSR